MKTQLQERCKRFESLTTTGGSFIPEQESHLSFRGGGRRWAGKTGYTEAGKRRNYAQARERKKYF